MGQLYEQLVLLLFSETKFEAKIKLAKQSITDVKQIWGFSDPFIPCHAKMGVLLTALYKETTPLPLLVLHHLFNVLFKIK